MARPAKQPLSVRLFGYALVGGGLVALGIVLPLVRDDVAVGTLLAVVAAGVVLGGVVAALLSGRARQLGTLALLVVGLLAVLSIDADLAVTWLFAAMLGIAVGVDVAETRRTP